MWEKWTIPPVIPIPPFPRGVRKYRSLEEAELDKIRHIARTLASVPKSIVVPPESREPRPES